MWQVLVPLLVVCLSDAAVAQAEPDGASATPPLTHSGSVNEAWLCAAPQRSTSPFFSHFTLESFGVNSSNVAPGYMLSSAYLASFYDLQGLECPDCILGPRNLSRPTLPPFGATVTVRLIGDHLELFAGFGGIEAWKAEGVSNRRDISRLPPPTATHG